MTEAEIDRQIRVVSSLREAGASQAELDALAAVWAAESGKTTVETTVTDTGHEVDAVTAETLSMLERRHKLPGGVLELELAAGMPVPRYASDIMAEEPSRKEQLADLFPAGRQATPRSL